MKQKHSHSEIRGEYISLHTRYRPAHFALTKGHNPGHGTQTVPRGTNSGRSLPDGHVRLARADRPGSPASTHKTSTARLTVP